MESITEEFVNNLARQAIKNTKKASLVKSETDYNRIVFKVQDGYFHIRHDSKQPYHSKDIQSYYGTATRECLNERPYKNLFHKEKFFALFKVLEVIESVRKRIPCDYVIAGIGVDPEPYIRIEHKNRRGYDNEGDEYDNGTYFQSSGKYDHYHEETSDKMWLTDDYSPDFMFDAVKKLTEILKPFSKTVSPQKEDLDEAVDALQADSISLEDFTAKVNEDGSILLVPKKKAPDGVAKLSEWVSFLEDGDELYMPVTYSNGYLWNFKSKFSGDHDVIPVKLLKQLT